MITTSLNPARGFLLFWILLLFSTNTCAQLLQNMLIGNPKAISLGNAVTADPPGIDSIHFNPAGLSRLDGRQYQIKFVLGDIDITGEFKSNSEYDKLLEDNNEVDPVANTKSSIDSLAVYSPFDGISEVPMAIGAAGGASYSPPGSKFTFGTSAYTPLAGGYIRDEDDPGRFYGKEAALARITFFSPTISYELTPQLSLGASIGFSYFGAGVTIDFRAPNVVLGALKNITDAACHGEDNGIVYQGVPLDLCGGELSPFESILYLDINMEKSLSTTFNLGVLWEPVPWLSIGGVYQSEAVDDMEGDVLLRLTDNVIGFTQGLADSNPMVGALIENLELTENHQEIRTKGRVDFTLPAHAALGLSLQLTPDIKFNVDWKWTQTSKWDEITFNVDKFIPLLDLLATIGVSNVSGTSLTVPRGYKDSSNFAYGIEYQYSDRTALRFGYEPRDTGIPDNTMDFLIPLGDFDLYGFGISHQLPDKSVFDVAIAYAKSEIDVKAGSSTNGNDSRLDNFIYNPSAGMDVSATVELMVFEMSYRTYF